MANALITSSMIMRESLMQLKNNLRFAKLANREYDKEFRKVGDTVNARKPVKFYTADGATRVNQDVTEGKTPVVLDQRKHVSWKFSTQDLTLSIENYSKRYIEPAMITLAQTIDAKGADLYKKVWNVVGTPGTPPANYAAVGAVARRLTEMGVPNGKARKGVMNPEAFQAIAATLTTLNMPQKAMEAWESGEIGSLAGFRTFESVNLKTHTVGSKAGTPLINGASQNVAITDTVSGIGAVKDYNAQTLITDGWTASSAILKAGDVFTIAGVFAVNPVPGEGTTGKTVLPYLQQFVVREDISADGSGLATIKISPAIIVSGAYQTVSAAPADNAAITVLGTAATGYQQNLFFHEDAFTLVTAPLEMPDGASWKEREESDGISMRLVKDYDIANDEEIIRVDVLYGWTAVYPDLAARLTS
jgi:hypothetical protein